MNRTHPIATIILCGALALCAGCGDQGSYELSWTIGCGAPPAAGCQLSSIIDCSRRGLDSVEVVAIKGEAQQASSLFPCFTPGEGPTGQGPGLDAGEVSLEVYGLSAGGLRLTEPGRVTVSIPQSGHVQAQVDIPAPPQCRDGVDNDLDGAVDLLDPQCEDSADADESS